MKKGKAIARTPPQKNTSFNHAAFDPGTGFKIIAILRGITPSEAPDIAGSLINSGIRLIEVPLNSPSPFDSIRSLCSSFAQHALIGAGTVLSADDAVRVADAGGQFLVSPNTDADVIRTAIDLGLVPIPGILTPSEAFSATRAGATHLKLFPASAVGPTYVHDLRAVLPPGTALFAVGGVDTESLSEWLGVGVDGVGIGSGLYKPGDDSALVAHRAKSLVKTIKAAEELVGPGIPGRYKKTPPHS